MGKVKLISVSIMFLFLVSVNGQVDNISGQSEFISMHFEIWYYLQAGSRTSESYALYIKQALAPIGIDVQIIVKPWGQFVGDLLHNTVTQAFDMAHLRFEGGGPTPGFMNLYHSSKTSFGQSLYQLNSTEFQAWQKEDAGIDNEEIDQLLENIEYELDFVLRKELITEFNELFMSNLLYDLPLVAKTNLVTMWKGFGGENNELWNPDEGIIESRKFGAVWTNTTSEIRNSNSTHMKLSMLTPAQDEMFDPNQAFDFATSDITRYMNNGLLDFDSNFTAHPGIAWNYYIDYTPREYDRYPNDTNSKGISTYQMTWFLGNDSYWPETIDIDGNVIPAERVDAQDFVLAYNMFKHPLTKVNVKESFYSIEDYYVNSTLFTNDTFTIKINVEKASPNDYYNFGKVSPVPYHILGGVLDYNSTHSASVDDFSLDFNPQRSQQWIQWASFDGHSLAGAYDIDEYVTSEYYLYLARDDYWYPNENDVLQYYDSSAFSQLEPALDYLFDVFAPHENNVNPNPLYWSFDENISSQGLLSFEYVVIDDIYAQLFLFEDGDIDSFVSTELGTNNVERHQHDDNFIMKEKINKNSQELLVFNLLNPNLKKINIRLAIAHSIDKNELVKIHDGFAVPHHSVVWPKYSDWIVESEIGYDPEISKDLIRLEGYGGDRPISTDYTTTEPPVTTEDAFLGNDTLFLVTAIVTICVTGVRKRKIN